MEIEHFSHEHPLILTEVLETDGEKGVICSGCEESVLGPGYKCYECNFLLHKSCAELPMEIQHPLHPNHTLTLRPKYSANYCDACLKICTNSFSYDCNSCNFNLDIKCASQSRIDTDNSRQHQHVFTHFYKQIQFICEACGEECKDIASLCSLCSICQLLVHTKCANFPSTIEIAAHNHSLSHNYSLRQVKELKDIVFCKLCYKEINPNYAAYYCQECDYVAHAICTYKVYVFDGPLKKGKEAESGFEEINLKGDEEAESGLEEINLNGDEEAGEIKHFSHQHNLVLNCDQCKFTIKWSHTCNS
ncbi:hypothetical protein CJ030_MR1G028866 [Morella rubra]|uniref:Phorbol-ester/DAG-type domain-containing protein n=1 Tax=Morella rubra TaxID=262757 RepID=A0A6A1WQE1_9ROSI|nr:hypothetical protein CJ030_MR1G028866 [Morella rubra]